MEMLASPFAFIFIRRRNNAKRIIVSMEVRTAPTASAFVNVQTSDT